MKKRSSVNLIILLLIILSFISILNYIKSLEIENIENEKADYNTDDFLFESIYSLNTDYKLIWTLSVKDIPKNDFNCHFKELSGNYKNFIFTIISGTIFSLKLFELFTNFSTQEAPKEGIPREIEGVKLTEVERKIFEVIQEFINSNRIFNKEKAALYIKSRHKVNGNLNYNGIKVVIDSLIKKNIIVEGSKLTRKSVLLNSNRNQIFNLIKQNPGVYKNILSKKLKITPYVVNWHLTILKKFHLIREHTFRNQISYFLFSLSSKNDVIFHTISKDKCMRIIEFLKKNEKGCSKYQIVKVLRMHYNTITNYLNKLEKFNLLIRKKDLNKDYLFLNDANFKKLTVKEKN